MESCKKEVLFLNNVWCCLFLFGGNNNDDFVLTLSRSFHQGLVDKARQMNYDKDDDDVMYD